SHCGVSVWSTFRCCVTWPSDCFLSPIPPPPTSPLFPYTTLFRSISTLLMLMAMFGVMFEMPVLGFLFARIGLLRSEPLVRNRRWAIVGGLVAAALITPTGDPFNLALVAVPLLVLFELTVVVVRLSQRRALADRMDHAREDPEPTG